MTEKKSYQKKIEEEDFHEVFLDEKINIVQSGETFIGHEPKRHVYSVLLFKNLEKVVSCSRDCTIAIFDYNSRELLHSSDVHNSIVRHLCRIDDKHVVSGCDDGILVKTSVEDYSREVFLRLSDIKDEDLTDVGIYYILKLNEKMLCILTDDNIFVFVDLHAEKERRVVKTCGVLSAHSKLVLSKVNQNNFYYNSSRIDNNAIRVFDYESMKVVHERKYEGHKRMVYAIEVIRKNEKEELIICAGFGDYIFLYNSLSWIRKDIMLPLSVVRSLFVLPQMSTRAKYQYLLVGLRDSGNLYSLRLGGMGLFTSNNEEELRLHGYKSSQVFEDGIRDIQLISDERRNVIEVLCGSYDSTSKIIHVYNFIEDLESEHDDQRERLQFLFSRVDLFDFLGIKQWKDKFSGKDIISSSGFQMMLIPRLICRWK